MLRLPLWVPETTLPAFTFYVYLFLFFPGGLDGWKCISIGDKESVDGHVSSPKGKKGRYVRSGTLVLLKPLLTHTYART